MSVASQSNDSIKRDCTGPFGPSVTGDNAITPVAVTATNVKIESQNDLPPLQILEGKEDGTTMSETGVNIKVEPSDGLEPRQIQETQQAGTNTSATSINGTAPQPLLGTQQLATTMNAPQFVPGTQQLGTNIAQSTMNVKIEASNNLPLQQAPVAQQVGLNMHNNFAATSLVPGTAQNAEANKPNSHLLKTPVAMTTPIVPTMTKKPQTAVPMSQTTHENLPKLLGTTMTKNIQNLSSLGGTPGTVRSSNGGGGQLLQFPWKLHEMLHLAEKNGKTAIISWLPGGNGFKVHNKEKFCAEIMPGYFASQKYKTFQRSLNLWGFESVAKGPDRGACYHQYFVKGHPELCHSM